MSSLKSSIVFLVCAGIFMLHHGIQASDKFKVSSDFSQTYNKIDKLEIENVTGQVKFVGWGKDEVQVYYIKKARNQHDLDNLEVDIYEEGDRLIIETDYPRNCRGCAIDFVISVPKTFESINAQTVTGSIELSRLEQVTDLDLECTTGSINGDFSCQDIHCKVVTGGINLTLNNLPKDHNINLTSVTGGITLNAPANLDSEVNLQAVTGSIHTDFGVTTQGEIKRNHLEGTIGNGKGMISISTTTGSITLKRL